MKTRQALRHSATVGTALVLAAAVAAVSAVDAMPASAASAGSGAAERFGGDLAAAVRVRTTMRHLDELQEIADANGGTRAAGTSGYDASVRYVSEVLRSLGYQVTSQEFGFNYFAETAPPELAQLTPSYSPISGPNVMGTYLYSGGGDVSAPVQPVDVTVPPTEQPSSTSGCEADDFAGFTPGSIALVQRGTCRYLDKVNNAVAAGASAVVVFNEGQPGRTALHPGTLYQPVPVPVVGVSYEVGERFVTGARAGTVTARVRTAVHNEPRTTTTVLAETVGGDAANVVMAGAHLDSTYRGPGMNDNGSGVAALLEIATRLAARTVDQKVRFAFWGEEELAGDGAYQYLDHLDAEQLAAVRLYLNADMVASPNFARYVSDGDDSDHVGAPAGPPGSGRIEALLREYFADAELPVLGDDLSPYSDDAAFGEYGVPIGGVFAGAEGLKTEREAELFGGVAGSPFDPCNHQACDTTGNISELALGQNTRATAYAIGHLAVDLTGIPDRRLPAGQRSRQPGPMASAAQPFSR